MFTSVPTNLPSNSHIIGYESFFSPSNYCLFFIEGIQKSTNGIKFHSTVYADITLKVHVKTGEIGQGIQCNS